MAIENGTIYTKIEIQLSTLEKNVTEVKALLDKVGKTTEETSKKATSSFGSMFKSMFSAQAAYSALQGGVNALVGAIKDSIKVSVSAQEQISKFGVIFSDVSKDAESVSNSFAKNFDLAGASAKELLGNTGNLLTGMGATQEEALALSLEVNTLAADLASFTNIEGGADRASKALTSALLGERESAKSLGLVIREVDINTILLKKGQDKLTGSELSLAKAQATLQIITEQAKNSIGDYARTSDSAANSQKRAAEATKELQIVIGTGLNPVLKITSDLWAKIATDTTTTIKKENEYAELSKKVGSNSASYEERIKLLQIQREIQKKEFGEKTEYAKKSLKDIDDQIAKLKIYQDNENAANKRIKDEANLATKADEDSARKSDEEAKRKEVQALVDQQQIDARKKAEKEYNEAIASSNFNKEKGLITEKELTDQALTATKTYINALYDLGYANETEMGTKGQNALNGLIEKYPELIQAIKDLEEAEKEREAEKDRQAQKEQDQIDAIKTGIVGTGMAISAMTEALVLGEDVWAAFAKSGLTSIAAVLDAMGAQLAAQAAYSIASAWNTAGVSMSGAIPALAGSMAAYASAGIVRGFAGSFEDGGIVPGSSYSGDKLIANVNSGEEIINVADRGRIIDAINGMNGQIIEIHNYTVLDGKQVARSVTRQQRNGKV